MPEQPELNLSQVTTNWTRKPKVGEKVFQDGVEYKVVEEFLGFYYGKKKYARENTLLDPAKTKFLTEEKLSRDEIFQLLKGYVQEEFLKDNFVKEIGVFGRLRQKYPDLTFWREYFRPDFKVKSLLWFLGGGSKDIELQYKKWTYNPDLTNQEKTVNIGTEKVGEDIEVKKKPKNLLDLLK